MTDERGRGSSLYGRRRGRKLRPGRQRLLEEVFSRFAIALPKTGPLPWPRLFDAPKRALWVEIGFGMGEHLAWQAERHPEIGFIGCEPYRDGIAALLARAQAANLKNLRIYPEDGMALVEALPEASVARLFALFPDPWPKARHHKRRLIRAASVPALARALADGAELCLATDDPPYARAMLFHLARDPAFLWTAERPADWRTRPADAPETRYEAKAKAAGRPGVYLLFRRRPRPR